MGLIHIDLECTHDLDIMNRVEEISRELVRFSREFKTSSTTKNENTKVVQFQVQLDDDLTFDVETHIFSRIEKLSFDPCINMVNWFILA